MSNKEYLLQRDKEIANALIFATTTIIKLSKIAYPKKKVFERSEIIDRTVVLKFPDLSKIESWNTSYKHNS